MGAKGGGSGGGSNSMGFQAMTSTYTPAPEALAAYRKALSMAENVTSKPFTPYQGALQAGFVPDQLQAFEATRQMQGIANPYINSATSLVRQGVDYSDPRNFNARTVAQYENPYQQQVVNATLENLKELQAQGELQNRTRAATQGTFGGSGEFRGRAEIARQQALANAQTLGGLQQQGYQQAVNQYNQQQQQAISTAQNAAYGLGQLGQQAQNAAAQSIQALLGTGGMQRDLAQQQLTGAYQQWQQAQAFPFQQTAFYSGIAGGIAPSMGGTTNSVGFGTSNSQQQQPSGGGGGAGMLTSALSLLPTLFSGSDERTKTNIEPWGSPDPETGLQAYSYDDVADVAAAERGERPMPPKRVSIMAQDLEAVQPEDVVDLGGLKAIRRNKAAEGGVADSTPTNSQNAPSTGFAPLVAPMSSADATSNFISGVFDPQTADRMARAKWVNDPQAPGMTPMTGDNYVVPPGVMGDTSSTYPYHPLANMPKAHGGAAVEHDIDYLMGSSSPRPHRAVGGKMGDFGALMMMRPFADAPDSYIPDVAQFGVRPAKDPGPAATEAGINAVKRGLPDLPGPTSAPRAPSGGGGGGGRPKMPSMKSAKGTEPKHAETTPKTDSEDTTTPHTDGPASATPHTDGTTSATPQTSIVSVPSTAPLPEFQFEPISPLLTHFEHGGRVHKDGGGAAGGGFASLGQGGGLGDIVLGNASSPSDAAGFANLMNSQETLTGKPLLDKWNAAVFANDPGPQLSPVEQGMPAMPDAKYYTTPREDLPGKLMSENYGKENASEIPGMMAMMGGKGMGGLGLAMMINQQQRAANAGAEQAKLQQKRADMLADPKNFPVEGYYSKISDLRLNPRTGLFNIDYIAPYRGMPFRDGGRVHMAAGGLTREEQAAVDARIQGIINAESRGNPRAQNSRSSAGGLGQFIDSTWLTMARKTNPALAHVPDRQVLAMKKDASPEGVQFQREVLHRFTTDNALRLKQAGLPITPENLYSVHFSGGTKIAGASPNTKMASLLDRAARAANPSIARMTVGQFNEKMRNHMGTPSPTRTAMTTRDEKHLPMIAPRGTHWTGPDLIDDKTGQSIQDARRLVANVGFNAQTSPHILSDREVVDAVGRGEKINYDAQGRAVGATTQTDPQWENRPRYDYTKPSDERVPLPVTSPTPTAPPPVATTTKHRFSLGDLNPISTAHAGDRGVYPGDEAAPQQERGFKFNPRYDYAPGVREDRHDFMTQFGQTARKGETRDELSESFFNPMQMTQAPLSSFGDIQPPVAQPSTTGQDDTAPPQSTPLTTTGTTTAPHKFWGDYRDVEKSDFGDMIDTLAGDRKMSDVAGTAQTPMGKFHGEAGDLGALFDMAGTLPQHMPFANGGTIRAHKADGGYLDPFNALGEGLGSAVSSVGEGLGALFDAGEQPRATQSERAAPATTLSPDFFTRWSENPLSQLLFNAGVGMMASDRANPLQAVGEGFAYGLPAFRNAVEVQHARDEDARERADTARRTAEFRRELDGARREEPQAPSKPSSIPSSMPAPAVAPPEQARAAVENEIVRLARLRGAAPDAASRAEVDAMIQAQKYKLAEIDRHAQEGRSQVRLLSKSEYPQYGVPVDYPGPVQVRGNGELIYPGGMAPPDAFQQEAKKKLAETYQTYADAGQSAQETQGLLDTAEELSRGVDTGVPAVIQKRLNQYGINIGKDADKVAAINAIYSRVTPTMKIPGAGATSDFDARMFESALPSLRNTPEGNAIIFETARSVNAYKMERAQIASAAMAGEIPLAEAQRRISELGDPFSRFKQYRAEHQETKAPAEERPAMPEHGATIEHNGATYSWDSQSQKYKRVK